MQVDHADIVKKVDALHEDLREKEESLQEMDELNQTLIMIKRKSDDELQEARHTLIKVSVLFKLYLHFPFVIL